MPFSVVVQQQLYNSSCTQTLCESGQNIVKVVACRKSELNVFTAKSGCTGSWLTLRIAWMPPSFPMMCYGSEESSRVAKHRNILTVLLAFSLRCMISTEIAVIFYEQSKKLLCYGMLLVWGNGHCVRNVVRRGFTYLCLFWSRHSYIEVKEKIQWTWVSHALLNLYL